MKFDLNDFRVIGIAYRTIKENTTYHKIPERFLYQKYLKNIHSSDELTCEYNEFGEISETEYYNQESGYHGFVEDLVNDPRPNYRKTIFNQYGNIQREIEIDEEENEHIISEYFYDDNNDLISTIMYYGDNGHFSKRLYKKIQGGWIIETYENNKLIGYNISQNSKYSSMTCVYNSESELREIIMQRYDNENANSMIVSSKIFDSSNSLLQQHQFFYDNNNLVMEIEKNSSGDIVSKINSIYNHKGIKKSVIQKKYGNKSELSYITKSKFNSDESAKSDLEIFIIDKVIKQVVLTEYVWLSCL